MHYIRYEDLYDVVLNDIRQYAEMAKNHEQEFINDLSKLGSDKAKKQLMQNKKEMVKAEKRLSEISLIIKRLYEDSVIVNGERQQKVDIYYNFVGIIS